MAIFAKTTPTSLKQIIELCWFHCSDKLNKRFSFVFVPQNLLQMLPEKNDFFAYVISQNRRKTQQEKYRTIFNHINKPCKQNLELFWQSPISAKNRYRFSTKPFNLSPMRSKTTGTFVHYPYGLTLIPYIIVLYLFITISSCDTFFILPQITYIMPLNYTK